MWHLHKIKSDFFTHEFLVFAVQLSCGGAGKHNFIFNTSPSSYLLKYIPHGPHPNLYTRVPTPTPTYREFLPKKKPIYREFGEIPCCLVGEFQGTFGNVSWNPAAAETKSEIAGWWGECTRILQIPLAKHATGYVTGGRTRISPTCFVELTWANFWVFAMGVSVTLHLSNHHFQLNWILKIFIVKMPLKFTAVFFFFRAKTLSLPFTGEKSKAKEMGFTFISMALPKKSRSNPSTSIGNGFHGLRKKNNSVPPTPIFIF